MDKFDFSKIDNFAEHIKLSIPNYDGLVTIMQAFFTRYMPEGGRCIDVGCSDGRFLNAVSKCVAGEYIGIDLHDFGLDKNYQFIKADAADYLQNIESCDILICLFTLQFMSKPKRQQAVAELGRIVKQGATLLIAEKIYNDCPIINSVLHTELIRHKRNSFTDKEILDKEIQLAGSMFCNKQSEIVNELAAIGSATQVWQSYNFNGWVVA